MTAGELKKELERVSDDTPVEIMAAGMMFPTEKAQRIFINWLDENKPDGFVLEIFADVLPSMFIHRVKQGFEERIRGAVNEYARLAKINEDLLRSADRGMSKCYYDDRLRFAENAWVEALKTASAEISEDAKKILDGIVDYCVKRGEMNDIRGKNQRRPRV